MRIEAAQSGTSASVQSGAPTPLQPMPADAEPSFEVVTIKPSDTPSPHGRSIRINGRQVLADNMSVRDLIVYAYGLHVRQIAGGTSSLMGRSFDVDGIPDVIGHPNRAQSRLMFQKLLASRFNLKFHYESRSIPAYSIRTAKGGTKLAVTTRKPGEATEFSYVCPPVLTVRNYSMAQFAKGMQDGFLDKPVVDQTGLKERYDFDLKWTADESQTYCPANGGESNSDPNAPPGIYTAIQEQLGLRLFSTKARVQVMVIDKIETPAEN